MAGTALIMAKTSFSSNGPSLGLWCDCNNQDQQSPSVNEFSFLIRCCLFATKVNMENERKVHSGRLLIEFNHQPDKENSKEED